MARRDYDRYEDEYYDDPEAGYEGEEDELEDGPPEEGQVLQQVPWFAIAFAVHAILLVILQTIVISSPDDEEEEEVPYVFAEQEDEKPPEMPEEEPEDPKEVEDVVAHDVVETYDEATDERNEDPTETEDNNERAPSEVPSDSNIDANNEASGFSAAMGAGGNAGGGGGPGGGGGNELLRARRGGRRDTDRHVTAGLKWLADHQEVGGYWDSDNFAERGPANGRTKGSYGNINVQGEWDEDTGHEEVDLGLTGLATLAFLGAGHTHESGEFAPNVRDAIRFMNAQQDRDGSFGSRHARSHDSFMYGHALCTMAMAEAFLMTEQIALRSATDSAIKFIAEAQNRDEEAGPQGWRYGVQPGISDTSVTGWMALALKSCKLAGLEVPQDCWDGAIAHLDEMTGEEDTGGLHGASSSGGNARYKTGYTERAFGQGRLRGYEAEFDPNGALDAINIMTRFFVTSEASGGDEANGHSLRADPVLRAQARQMLDQEPHFDASDRMGSLHERDYYYWYYASLAMYQMGGELWENWETPMRTALIESQRLADGEDEEYACYGSWDTDSAWGKAGGRVYATAINVLTLEVYYRYQRKS